MKPKDFINKIIFKKFEIKKETHKSFYSRVYEGINITNNIPVALKIEKDKNLKYLESEAYLLVNLKGFGIPEVISYGKKGQYNILIEELLGPNIEILWKKYGYKIDSTAAKSLTLKDICLLAIQCLERLKYIHNKDVIHRDVKPHNFTIGRNDPQNLYLIDFGFARKFRSSRTGKHIKFTNKHKLIGSVAFSSSNAIRGYEQSRRDDLESLGYLLLYLAKGGWLPWLIYHTSPPTQNSTKKTRQMKLELSEENLCKGLPIEFTSYMKYVKNLEFEEDPDYKYLNGLFLSILSINNLGNELSFFWLSKQKSKIFSKTDDSKQEKKKINNIFTKKSISQKKESSKKRLYNRIKKILDKRNSKLTLDSDNKIINNENDKIKNHLRINSEKFEFFPETKINMKLDDNSNVSKKLNFEHPTTLNDYVTNETISPKEKYSKLKDTKLRYAHNKFVSCDLEKNNININIIQNLKIYKKIYYNNPYFFNGKLTTKNSSFMDVENNGNKITKNKKNFNEKKIYKSVIKNEINDSNYQ